MRVQTEIMSYRVTWFHLTYWHIFTFNQHPRESQKVRVCFDRCRQGRRSFGRAWFRGRHQGACFGWPWTPYNCYWEGRREADSFEGQYLREWWNCLQSLHQCRVFLRGVMTLRISRCRMKAFRMEVNFVICIWIFFKYRLFVIIDIWI